MQQTEKKDTKQGPGASKWGSTVTSSLERPRKKPPKLEEYTMPTDKPEHGMKKDAVEKYIEENRIALAEAEAEFLAH